MVLKQQWVNQTAEYGIIILYDLCLHQRTNLRSGLTVSTVYYYACTQQNYYLGYREVALKSPRSTSKSGSEGTISPVKNPCATHDEVPMVYLEGNFGVQLEVASWWPTYTGHPRCSLVMCTLLQSTFAVPLQSVVLRLRLLHDSGPHSLKQ